MAELVESRSEANLPADIGVCDRFCRAPDHYKAKFDCETWNVASDTKSPFSCEVDTESSASGLKRPEFADDHSRDDRTLPEDIARGTPYDRTLYVSRAVYVLLDV